MLCLQKRHESRKIKPFSQYVELNKYGYLQPRDIDLLKLLYKFRFMSRSQIEKLSFKGKTLICQRRLLKLYNYGIIDRFRPVSYGSGTNEYIYCLDSVGAYFLAQNMNISVSALKWRKRDNQVNLFYIHHFLEIVNTYIELYRFNIRIIEIEPDYGYFKPDIYIEISHLGYRYYFFIEVDRATERQKKIRQKIWNYEKYCKMAPIMPEVIFTVPDKDRKAQLSRWINTGLKVHVTTNITSVIFNLIGGVNHE